MEGEMMHGSSSAADAAEAHRPRHHHHHHHHHHDQSEEQGGDLHSLIASAGSRRGGVTMTSSEEEEGEVLKARIASHRLYPSLLQAYINCQKVGAPPEIASLLDDIIIHHHQQQNKRNYLSSSSSFPLGSDLELDHFMETYCEVLVRYRSDLARPFQEATAFLNTIHSQLSDLSTTSNGTDTAKMPPFPAADDVVGSSEEEESGGETDELIHFKGENKDLKNRLLRKYSGYLSSLRQEFSKKKKKGKLPKEARQTLLEWWTSHYKWPYPTEQDKIALAETTGLDQKQINNWFINQRKRHWKPPESMQFAVMGNLSAPFYDD